MQMRRLSLRRDRRKVDKSEVLRVLRWLFPNAEVKEGVKINRYTAKEEHVILAQSKKDGGDTWRIEIMESRSPERQIAGGPDPLLRSAGIWAFDG